MPTALRRLTLLIGNGLRVVNFPATHPGASVKADAALHIHPTAKALVWTDDTKSTETPTEAQVVQYLRAKKLLPANNQSNPAEGIYQSDTGQLTLDTKRKVMTVDTPRSQAVSLPEGSEGVRLRDFNVTNLGDSATFFIGSLDGKPVAESQRMLILTVGDAVNTGAKFSNSGRKVLQELGTLPILVKPIKAKIELKRTLRTGEKVTMRALAFNGDPLAEIPVQVSGRSIDIAIDTSSMSNTVFQYEMTIGQ